MKILDHKQIDQKIQRLSYQILEANFDSTSLYLIGINNNGYKFAQLLKDQLSLISEKNFILHQIKLNPAAPLDADITLDMDITALAHQRVVIVDDVANTGRTIFYAFKPFLDILTEKIEVAVLIDRKHKAYPIKVDFVGTSLATTIKEHIKVDLKEPSFNVTLH